MSSLDQFARGKLAELEAAHLRRHLIPSLREEGIWIRRGNRRLLSFCCNDYLNLSQHPAVKAAAQEAVARFGVGAGASRLITGNHPLNEALETRLARLKQTEAALVFGSGYLANIGIIPALVGPGDAVLVDELAHACIFAGAKLSGAAVLIFRHNDVAHAAEFLESRRGEFRRVLLATDGVFSMDGDLAPLPELSALCQRHDVWLMTDDAHGIGVIGGGRGSAFAFDEKPEIAIQMGTLSKAVGSYGAYVCGSEALIGFLKTRARSLIYTTGLPPPVLAASIAALDVIEAGGAFITRPLAKARLFTERAGLALAQSPIVPIVIGSETDAMARAAELDTHDFLVTAIRPPTVPPGTARLRLTFTANHPDEAVLKLADLVRAWPAFS